MTFRAGLYAALLVSLALLPGCRFAPAAGPPLPTVAWEDTEEVREILIDRQTQVRNVQAECRVRFVDPANPRDTQTLSGALVLEGENRVRLRTWKLNQTVFDLTVNDDGIWVAAIDELKQESADTPENLAQFADQLGKMLRGPDYGAATFASADQARAVSSTQKPLRLTWDYGRGLVNRQTLTLETFVVRQDDADTQITCEYALYDGLYWFGRLKLNGDFGELEIIFRNVELNGELNTRAFKPPRRAVKIEPADGDHAL